MSCQRDCAQGKNCDCGEPVDAMILAILFCAIWAVLGLIGLFHVVRWVL